MAGRHLRISLLLAVCACISHISCGQIVLTGMVADSASMQALPNVNLVSKKSGRATATDLRGGFSLQASEGDSIVFSRVGYHSKILPVKEVRNLVIVFLKEEHKMLKPVEIRVREELIWLPPLPAESPWKNPTWDRRFTEIPGFQGIQTFGPGYVFKGVLSRFSKIEREKRKLARVQEENYRAREYVSLVNDPGVKAKIMTDYKLSEEEYYRLLALFNEKNQDVIYRLEGHEVISLMLLFYSENAKKE